MSAAHLVCVFVCMYVYVCVSVRLCEGGRSLGSLKPCPFFDPVQIVPSNFEINLEEILSKISLKN